MKSDKLRFMKISLVMPVHNEECYLSYSLRSLLDAPVSEFIFVLDHSIDNSEEILKFALKHPRCKILKKTKSRWLNPSAESYCYGAQHATGEKVYFIDADVVLDQFSVGTFGLTSLEAIASGRPAITYVSSKYRTYDDFPLKDINTVEQIADAVGNMTPNLWEEEYTYLNQNHDPAKVANCVTEIYEQLFRG